MEAFRAYLGDWLARTGTSQAELGRRSGVAQNVISQWLGPVKRRPSDANLRKLAPILGVAYEDLLRMCGYLPGEPSLDCQSDPALATLIARWPRLSSSVREAIEILVAASDRLTPANAFA